MEVYDIQNGHQQHFDAVGNGTARVDSLGDGTSGGALISSILRTRLIKSRKVIMIFPVSPTIRITQYNYVCPLPADIHQFCGLQASMYVRYDCAYDLREMNYIAVHTTFSLLVLLLFPSVTTMYVRRI